MKIFLTSAMLIFLTLSAILNAQHVEKGYSSDICIGCEEGRSKEVPNMFLYTSISQLNQILSNYEHQGVEYQLDFNYHVGYIRGQLKAYQEICEMLSGQDSNMP